MSRLTDSLYSFIKSKDEPIGLHDICASDEFKGNDRKDISAALRTLGAQKIVFRSLKDGKAYYSTDSSKGEAMNPTKAWISDTASSLGGFVNRDGSNTDILLGGQKPPHADLFNAVDQLTNLAKELVGDENIIKGDASTSISHLTYNNSQIVSGYGYSVEIPDGFIVVTGDKAKEKYGETRDFMAYYTTEQFDEENALIKIYPGTEVQFTSINNENVNAYFPVAVDYLFKFEQVLYANQMAMMNMYGDAYEVKTKNSIAWCSYMDASTPDRSGGYHFFYINIPTEEKARMFRVDIRDIIVENVYEAKKLVEQIMAHFSSGLKLAEYDRLDSEKYTSTKLTSKLAQKWKESLDNLFGNVILIQNVASQTMNNAIQVEARLGNINTDQATITREYKKMSRVLVDDEAAVIEEIYDQVAGFFNKAAILNKDTKEIYELKNEALELIESWKEVSVTLGKGGEKVVASVNNVDKTINAVKNPVLMEDLVVACKEKIERIKEEENRNRIYKEAINQLNSPDLDIANEGLNKLKTLGDYRDSKALVAREEDKRKERTYVKAKELIEKSDVLSMQKGIEKLREIGEFKDSGNLIMDTENRIKEIKKLEEEKRIAEETSRKKAEEEAKKKRKKNTIIISIILALCILMAVVYTTVIAPKYNYSKAVSLYESGKYAEAYEIFEKLNNYNDSSSYKEKCYPYYWKHSTIRKLKALNEGDSYKFGHYEQDGYSNNGEEDIEWNIIKKEDDRILLVSRYALVQKPFSDQAFGLITWDKSTLRDWLNNEFLSTAFTENEQNLLVLTTVTADKNQYYPDSVQGSDTMDKVFLLSIKEVEEYFQTEEQRVCKPTKGSGIIETMNYNKYKEACYWRLRTIGEVEILDKGEHIGETYIGVVIVDDRGEIFEKGFPIRTAIPIRPAIWLSLSE